MNVFSGIRPTGELHIGNYFGAIKQWLALQKQHHCIFCIVDLHAITTPFDPQTLPAQIKNTAISYLAAGLDPEQCVLFVQSDLPEHIELAWLLGTTCPLGELERMTQFKEKAKKHKKNVTAGLFNYPLLMAADILLYQTELVPVGKDQVQHIELTRELARKFNAKFGQTFTLPKELLSEGQKIMSLQNPKMKMSKTDSPESVINLTDGPEQIKAKIMRAVTDTGSEIKYSPAKKPGHPLS